MVILIVSETDKSIADHETTTLTIEKHKQRTELSAPIPIVTTNIFYTDAVLCDDAF